MILIATFSPVTPLIPNFTFPIDPAPRVLDMVHSPRMRRERDSLAGGVGSVGLWSAEEGFGEGGGIG